MIDDYDFLRELVQRVCKVLVDEELNCFLKAVPYERTGIRKGYRNCPRSRTLKIWVGSLELLMPRDREGRFQAELFERYQRDEKAPVLTLQEMFINRGSTRKVGEVTEALCGTEFSTSQVSRHTAQLDEQLRSWRQRPLQGKYP